MIKTQINIALPTTLAMNALSFTATKIDNSASTDPLMPAAKSPDFFYEGTRADGETQIISAYYDITDGYKKKILMEGVTTVLEDYGVNDGDFDISLEGDVNPISFIFSNTTTSIGYVYNPVEESVMAIGTGSGSTTSIIVDNTNFESKYNEITQMPTPVDMRVLFKTPNPLTATGQPAKSFTYNYSVENQTLVYTVLKDDSSSFSVVFDYLETPATINGIVFDKVVTYTDGGVITQYYMTEELSVRPVQLSGFIKDEDTGEYTPTESSDPMNGAVYNPDYDGFRIIFNMGDNVYSISLGGKDFVTSRSDAGTAILDTAARKAENDRKIERMRRRSHKASYRMDDPFKNAFKRNGVNLRKKLK